jgi:hypothetical protein
LYPGKLEKSRINKFLYTYVLQKLNQEDINHLNRSIMSKGIEAAIKSLPRKKRTSRFTAEFHQAFKEEVILMLLKPVH